MADVLVPVVAGLVGVVLGWILQNLSRETERRQRQAEALAAAVGPIQNVLDLLVPDSFALWASDRAEEYRKELSERFETHRDALTILEIFHPDTNVRKLIGQLALATMKLRVTIAFVIRETLNHDSELRTQYLEEAKRYKGEAKQAAEQLAEQARSDAAKRWWKIGRTRKDK